MSENVDSDVNQLEWECGRRFQYPDSFNHTHTDPYIKAETRDVTHTITSTQQANSKCFQNRKISYLAVTDSYFIFPL